MSDTSPREPPEVEFLDAIISATAAMALNEAPKPEEAKPSGPRYPPHIIAQRAALSTVATNTLKILPAILASLPDLKAASLLKYTRATLPRLDPARSPLFPSPATIRVLNCDTLNAAIALSARPSSHEQRRLRQLLYLRSPTPRVAVLNFASPVKPGGGFRSGALAQEEALCYRSSLALSLESRTAETYPLAADEALYSPDVLVVRGDMESGHELFYNVRGQPVDVAHRRPVVVSVLSVAAVEGPETTTYQLESAEEKEQKREKAEKLVKLDQSIRELFTAEDAEHIIGKSDEPAADVPCVETIPTLTVFARDFDRDLTKFKMRQALRMAAMHGHGLLVLGALGCGVFGNPPVDVAHCWLEVLRELEFSAAGNGGKGWWWQQIVFAVFDPKGNGNFEAFKTVLDGQKV